ncbi:alpha-xylosidase [Gracilibacillus boraciitolerans JCM 21714]|uniref:Alpha-xylosidase n=1 Tax=Gracilibacillus boraciitolerans JCM 21714 TaxID=1298598 RepID=W4VQ56_9BACI|nr:DUF5110 domain-containing protein [Gracilibacillus boraciitolerans]GAE95316.1 alpha-xylosidase [Gracilibacillus boraciitolerans JCM 21714]
MPLYVRAGSIVSIGPTIQYTSEGTSLPVEIHVYKGNDGSFLWYDDEGDNYNYEKGAYSTISLHWEDENNHLVIEARQGTYPSMKTSTE